jgi:hypothetical protein
VPETWWKSPRQIGGGVAIALLITLATGMTSHLIGTGRGVPEALIHVLQLGPRGQLAVKLAYCVAAGLAAAAALAICGVIPTPIGARPPVIRRVRIAVTVAVVLGCFVGPDFAVGSPSVGAYTSRGAYEFVSAPTLHPPIVRADAIRPGRLASGYIFLATLYNLSQSGTMVGQSGPLILDQHLSPVWFMPVPQNDLAANLSVQTYEGRPVLAWWQGQIEDAGNENGEYIVVDQHYTRVAELRGADGWQLSMHEIVIRGHDAWVTASRNVPVDLTRYGGADNGTVIDSAVQEYNLQTGQLVWSWDALAHIPLSDSWDRPPISGPWDAYHVNSIDLLRDGTFVVSMRNTWAGYKVDIASGRIEWTLGGKQSSFRFGAGADFQWQHDMVVYPGTPLVTVFDDHCCQVTSDGATMPPTGPSRGLVLKLDLATHTAVVAEQYSLGARFDSEYMGSIQPLRGGNEFVGWGSEPHFSEFTPSGRLLLDAVLPGPDITYRATVEPWVGLPRYPPDGAARWDRGRTIIYASWNGATQVASWRLLAGSGSTTLLPVGGGPKVGFETAIVVSRNYQVFRVQALDRRGRVLGTSAPFGITN